MITKYLLTLGIGHILGDFYFQTEHLAALKKQRYKGVVLHGLEYYGAMLVAIIPLFGLDMILAATYAALIHFVIDTVKYIVVRKKKIKRDDLIFVTDQIFHILSILILAYVMLCWNFIADEVKPIEQLVTSFNLELETIARWLLAILFIHKPSNIFIQKFISEYKPKEDTSVIKVENKVGRRIGTTERIIMLIFLALNQYSALGFVLTAKSIARYDRISKDQKFAEYYLLGTLVSTLCVIVCRLVVLQ